MNETDVNIDNPLSTVRIIVWRSQGSGSVGHAALVTFTNEGIPESEHNNFRLKMKTSPGIYVSFWPSGNCGTGCKQNQRENHFHTYEEDRLVTHHPMSSELHCNYFDLTDLDVKSINKFFYEKRPHISYKLFPQLRRIIFWNSSEENCCSLVYKLIKVGDTQNKISILHKQIINGFARGCTGMALSAIALIKFNDIGRFIMGNAGKSEVNIIGAIVFWLATATTFLWAFNGTRVYNIIMPGDIKSITSPLTRPNPR